DQRGAHRAASDPPAAAHPGRQFDLQDPGHRPVPVLRCVSAYVALVTGASAGMGRDIAWALAAAGYDLGVLGRRTEGLEETARGVAAAGRRSISLVAGVRDA